MMRHHLPPACSWCLGPALVHLLVHLLAQVLRYLSDVLRKLCGLLGLCYLMMASALAQPAAAPPSGDTVHATAQAIAANNFSAWQSMPVNAAEQLLFLASIGGGMALVLLTCLAGQASVLMRCKLFANFVLFGCSHILALASQGRLDLLFRFQPEDQLPYQLTAVACEIFAFCQILRVASKAPAKLLRPIAWLAMACSILLLQFASTPNAYFASLHTALFVLLALAAFYLLHTCLTYIPIEEFCQVHNSLSLALLFAILANSAPYFTQSFILSDISVLLLAFALGQEQTPAQADRQAQQLGMKVKAEAADAAAHAQQQSAALAQTADENLAKLLAQKCALEQINAELNNAYEEAEIARQQAERMQRQAMHCMAQLHVAQWQIIQAEKMAALGQLISGLAADIHAPVSVMQINGKKLSRALNCLLHYLPELGARLNHQERILFFQLIARAHQPQRASSQQAQRRIIRNLAQTLRAMDLPAPVHQAAILCQLQANTQLASYLPLLQHVDGQQIIEHAHQFNLMITAVNSINTAVERVSNIIHALKNYSHFDPRQVPTPCDLKAELAATLSLLQTSLPATIQVHTELAEVPAILCNREDLSLLCRHLLQNAMQAIMLVKKPDFQGELQVSLRQQNQQLVLRIKDNGTGIRKRHMGLIFRPFFSTHQLGQGRGLGLGIVNRIVEKYSGTLEVESTWGQGTCFTVYLPTIEPPSHKA